MNESLYKGLAEGAATDDDDYQINRESARVTVPGVRLEGGNGRIEGPKIKGRDNIHAGGKRSVEISLAHISSKVD